MQRNEKIAPFHANWERISVYLSCHHGISYRRPPSRRWLTPPAVAQTQPLDHCTAYPLAGPPLFLHSEPNYYRTICDPYKQQPCELPRQTRPLTPDRLRWRRRPSRRTFKRVVGRSSEGAPASTLTYRHTKLLMFWNISVSFYELFTVYPNLFTAIIFISLWWGYPQNVLHPQYI